MMRSVLLCLLLVAPAVQASGFAFPGPGGLTVQIRDPEGRPWSGVTVIIRSIGGLVHPSYAYTDRSGEAVFPVLCPGDDYEIHVHAEGQSISVFDDVVIRTGGYVFLLIHPYSLLGESWTGLQRERGLRSVNKEPPETRPWVDWSGRRDPLTGAYHEAVVPERLVCPDGIYPIVDPPDRETIRWLRRGFTMRYWTQPEEFVPTVDGEKLCTDGPGQGPSDHERPTSTSDWSGTRTLLGPS